MTTKNVVFIDSRVAGYETLIAGLSADTEWYLLDANQDGVDQMQRILAGYSDLDSVQVISHGSSGTLYLGSTVLNGDNLYSYQTQLQAIGSSLTETGDILLYGCNVAQGDVGVSFVNSLAQITGADVAASENWTGNLGDWVLEVSSGQINLDVSFESISYQYDLALISGTSGNDTLSGTSADDSIDGQDGNDLIDGKFGNDTIFGGNGNDFIVVHLASTGEADESLGVYPGETGYYYGGQGNDTYHIKSSWGSINIIESPSEGLDTVKYQGFLNYQLPDNVENFVSNYNAGLLVIGNDSANAITMQIEVGSLGYDTLKGGAGDDTLDGGLGRDYYYGGSGNDVFLIESPDDQVYELANEGTDEARSSVTYTIPDYVESLMLTGFSSINGVGNSGNNHILGNTTANQLDGKEGEDTLAGLGGDDTYIVDNAGDVVVEDFSEGTDVVKSSISYVLSDNVENLQLTGTAGTNGTGNDLANILIGNSGNNRLDGNLGVDNMKGYAGNDTYVVDSTGDVVVESLDAGNDTIETEVTLTSMAANVENLTLLGEEALNANGNSLANTLTGNLANNILDGKAGADTLKGGAGDDTYIVDNTGDVVTELTGGGIDTVKSSFTRTLGNYQEHLILTGTAVIDGTGNSLSNQLIGNGSNNVLTGLAGDDLLKGLAGADTMAGGAGNDIYYVDSLTDVITEVAGEGYDKEIGRASCRERV